MMAKYEGVCPKAEDMGFRQYHSWVVACRRCLSNGQRVHGVGGASISALRATVQSDREVAKDDSLLADTSSSIKRYL